MSQFKNERNMGDSSGAAGAIRRARERAEAGIPRGPPPSTPDISTTARRPQAPARLQTKDGTIGMAISRPTPVPQWPLAGPLKSPESVDSEPYRPPVGRGQPPQRPPRPSRVPSILDGSRVQGSTPVFQQASQGSRNSDASVPETPGTQSSRPSTQSSVGTIPDFPLPVAIPPVPAGPPRRSVNLGPPPSSRRGASSFYSNASFVSPIPEESPRIRSHTSYASSAAIPESYGTISPSSARSDAYFDDAIAEESVISDDADDSRLVRSASIGKRAKPSLITTKGVDSSDAAMRRPSPNPVQSGPFSSGTGYIEGSSSSSAPTVKNTGARTALTTDNMLSAFQGASATDPSAAPRPNPSPQPFRMSGLRRPPRLDIDAVRTAEARGSLTSLPDLIRRATRLASLMDRGRRPGSRFDDLDFPEETYGTDPEKNDSYELDKHQSGLSDMLAAFPPPASRRSMRPSISSWPLPRRQSRMPARAADMPGDQEQAEQAPNKRRCCGLPLWGFFICLILFLAVIAAAVAIPVELLVVDKKTTSQPVSTCMAELTCENGGTNVISDGVCSCICSNGFTGKNCTTATSQGCTTTTIDTGSMNIKNVTIGQAIPGLVLDAQTNFSVPLVATSILLKFSSSGLSCNSQNALVTVDGTALPNNAAVLSGVSDGSEFIVQAAAADASTAVPITLTIPPNSDTTIILSEPPGGIISETTITAATTIVFTGRATTIFENSYTATATTTSGSGYPTTTPPVTSTTPTSTSSTSTSSTSTSSAQPTGKFTVTDETVTFAQVAILFVLQEQSVDAAESAQVLLQQFFSNTTAVTTTQASNITIGNSNSIDLVDLFVDVGGDKVGGGGSS
ncbi:hypothetical protein F5Y16DRAFT_306129 [Xylariaceae sp. FL0255]|nr:hypothetical protein F5Y16DRAFT_306129 [Xylariaceae sp. FL0255]